MDVAVRDLRGRDGALSNGDAEASAEPRASKTLSSLKRTVSFPNVEQPPRELPICLCLKNKSPCVPCGASPDAWRKGALQLDMEERV